MRTDYEMLATRERRARRGFALTVAVIGAALVALDVGATRIVVAAVVAPVVLAWLVSVAFVPRGFRVRWAGFVAWTAASLSLLAL